MRSMTLKLAEGRVVPMEDGSDWPAKGATVVVTPYIRRRLRDGDLVAADETPPEADTAPAEPDASAGGDDTPAGDAAQTSTGRKARK